MRMLSYSEILDIKKIASNFKICDGEITHVLPVNGGKTNATYKIVVFHETDTTSYMLQRINTNVFKNLDVIVRNAELITSHLRKKGLDTLEYVMTKKDNTPLFIDASGTYRMTKFIHAEVFQTITRPEDMRMLGFAIGQFLMGLSDFDVNLIEDSIPNFHNTQLRFEDCLLSALSCVRNSQLDKINKTKEILNFVIENRDVTGVLVKALLKEEIPLRVTHNDTKLSNVLFDRKTNLPRCMIDLDTVMKGSVLYDLADAIRSGANTRAGQEIEYKKAEIDLELLSEFLIGFKQSAPNFLTKREIELLPTAIKILPLELGMRYLADYYNGDIYFHVSYEDQNYYRAWLQLALVNDINHNMPSIIQIVNDIFGN